MKTSIATAVSIAGVLVAGGAAFAVNSHVMDPSAPNSNMAAPATFGSTPSGVAGIAGTTTTDVPAAGSVSKDGSGALSPTPIAAASPTESTVSPATTSAPAAPVVSVPETTVSAPSLSTTFKVGTSGTVIASAIAGVVTIDSVSPAKGWTATRPRPVANGVEVDFTSSSTRVDFIVRLDNGKLSGSVNSRAIDDDDRWDNPRHRDDDDDDDEHEDHEDHEDREHEDDD